jgi:hypothetical protein
VNISITFDPVGASINRRQIAIAVKSDFPPNHRRRSRPIGTANSRAVFEILGLGCSESFFSVNLKVEN